MDIPFRGSSGHTLGIEIETAIVSDRTDELVCAAPAILAEVAAEHPGLDHPRIKRELFQCTLELITGVCRTPAEAHADLRATVAELGPALTSRELSLVGTGVHPFSHFRDLTMTEDPRYARIVDQVQWPVRRLMIHGVHFHVGVASGDVAVALTNALTGLLPHFLALSASSPFWLGEDAGLASVRTPLWEAMPSASLPPTLLDYADFLRLATALQRAGTIETVKELWWDIRPSPVWGTVELRMCDAMSTLGELCSLAALAQAAVAHLAERVAAGEVLHREPDWVLRENKWRAARHGIEAQLVHGDGSVTRLEDEVRHWVELVRPQSRALGGEAYLQGVLDIVDHRPSYARQRALVARGGSLRDVVGLLRREFAADRVGG